MYATLCCSVLQCVAVCCRDFHSSDVAELDVHHTVLQFGAVCCVCCRDFIRRGYTPYPVDSKEMCMRNQCVYKTNLHAKKRCVQ